MKIVRLTIHNFLKLKDVEMNPSHTNVIVGKNKQGKTSVLKAIREAFSGGADQSSIRIGGDKAEILIETEDLNIRRTLTEKGNYLDVSNKEGFKVPSPQKYLDGILGTFSFNPVEFFELKAADRKKYLLNAIKMKLTAEELSEFTGEKLAGIDYEQHALEVLADAHKYYYDKRTAVNAEVAKQQKTIAALTEQMPEGFDPKSVDEAAITKLREAIQTDKGEKIKADAHVQATIGLQKQEKELTEEIKRMQEKLKGIQDQIVAAAAVKFDFSDDVAMQTFEATLKEMEGKRELVFTARKVDEAREMLNAFMKDQENLDIIVKRLTKSAPDALIAKAELPVKGLEIKGNDVLIDGVNLDNLSASEQLKFGLEIVKKLNGAFKVICIDGVELLDSETFGEFLKMIENDDFQYFVTRVDGKTPNAVTIEEGEIKNA